MEQRSAAWYEARKGRLTGSNIGAALGVNPWKTPDDLIRQMVREYHGAESDFTGNAATEYGQLHEPLAVMDYMAKTGLHPEECGFFVHPDREWLGASPDALINDDGLLEVKCPFGLRNKKGADLVFKTAAEQPHYYAQMQVEMRCAGREWCDFYQWSPNGDSLERIYSDAGWWSQNLPLLEQFYQRFLSEIDNPEHLEPKEVEINTLAAKSLIAEYDRLRAVIEDAEAERKSIMSRLIEAAKGRNAVIHGRKLTQIERKGNIQYAKVPELKGLDLEPYRASPSTFWKLS